MFYDVFSNVWKCIFFEKKVWKVIVELNLCVLLYSLWNFIINLKELIKMKSLNLLLAGLLVLGLASCGGNKQAEATTDSAATQQVVEQTAPVVDSAVVTDSAAADTTKK